MAIHRANVRAAHLQSCVDAGRFLVSGPRPGIQAGDLILLQLTRGDAGRLGKLHDRIENALVVDHLEPDVNDEAASLWPDYRPPRPHLVFASAVLPVEPVSLEPPKFNSYDYQANPARLSIVDEAGIAPYLDWPHATPRDARSRRAGDDRATDTGFIADLRMIDGFGDAYVWTKPSPRAASLPFAVDPDKIDRGTLGHVVTQHALADFLSRRGIEPRRPRVPRDPDFDIGWRHRGFTYVGEVKSLTKANETKQLRLGLGQVLDYQDELLAHEPNVLAVLIVERRPTDDRWLLLCQRLGVLIIWPEVFDSGLSPVLDKQDG